MSTAWDGTRVLVTGAGGFIGSHLAERMVQLGAKTRAMVRYSSTGSRGWLDSSPHARAMEFVSGDIADPFFVRSAMKDIDVVFHLAALIAIPYSYRAPQSYVQTNIVGTVNVLEAARSEGTRLVVHTSTSEVYGSAQFVPITEAHPLVGQSPYSASKIGADKMAESYHLSFGVPVVTLRPFNTFGPRQSTRAVLPTIAVQLLSGAKELKLGSLTPTRDFNFVANTVDAFVAAAESPSAIGRTINAGSGREITVGDAAALLARITGREDVRILTEEQRLRPEASEVQRLCAANGLAKELLGWSPRVSLEDGLAQFVEWLRGNLERYRAEGYHV
jgi:dTDP-glucose 4,6-dehydratase